jgi:hypothetical protein
MAMSGVILIDRCDHEQDRCSNMASGGNKGKHLPGVHAYTLARPTMEFRP